MRRYLAFLLMLAAASAGFAASPPAPVTVFAAASLTDVMQQVTDQFTRMGGTPVKQSVGSSAVLARQIEAGAAADIFISADQDWMDYLAQRQLMRPGTRANLLGNRLALVAPADSRIMLDIAPGFRLAAALGGGRLALADPDSVPAGRYARAALTHLGVWNSVESRLVRADDVRGALAFVARGEASLGIVYLTDARADPRVRLVGLFPAESHPPIVYPLALTTTAGSEAARFLEFLRSAPAAALFERAGFTVLH